VLNVAEHRHNTVAKLISSVIGLLNGGDLFHSGVISAVICQVDES